jgi:hypothetical protein
MSQATADGSITGNVDLISGPSTFAEIDRSSNSEILWMRTA